jgi:molybdopterin converting factor small subunit
MSDREVLSQDEQKWHEKVCRTVRQAEEAYNEFREKLKAAEEDYIASKGAQQVWYDYLIEKYGLSDGDRVTEEGTIVRNQEAKNDT